MWIVYFLCPHGYFIFLETLLTHLNGVISRRPQAMDLFGSYGVETAWRLGDWSSLSQFLRISSEPKFEVMLGEVFFTAKFKNEFDFNNAINKARDSLIGSLCAASMESYREAYGYVYKLHILSEIEDFARNVHFSNEKTSLTQILRDWDVRLGFTSPTFEVRDLILTVRRLLLENFRFSILWAWFFIFLVSANTRSHSIYLNHDNWN